VKGQNAQGQDQDDVVIVPISTYAQPHHQDRNRGKLKRIVHHQRSRSARRQSMKDR
jgi:hypothetical protein